LHALELSEEDLNRCCGHLADEELHAGFAGMTPVAFQLRHIARSLDRLLTYAEGRELSSEQTAALQTESQPEGTRSELFSELSLAMRSASLRIRAFAADQMDEPRAVGKRRLPSTVAGLLVHVAEHTQRHVGEAITTSKLLLARRPRSPVGGPDPQ
jgi:uncharacterized damage-inducible protein DinB